MAFLGPYDLINFLSNNPVIADKDGNNLFDENRIEQASYALSLGGEAYTTDNKDKKTQVLNESNKRININPGQFALLLTDEYINVPTNKLALISFKAGSKLKGLINVSGFHVDPGWKGRLLFSVYNAGPAPIILEHGIPYFLIWFSDLLSDAGEKAYNARSNDHQNQGGIPNKYIEVLQAGDIASPQGIIKKIDDQNNSFDNKLDRTKSDFNTKIDTTKTDFNTKIDTAKNGFEIKIEEKNRKLLNNEYLLKLLIGILFSIFVTIILRFAFEIDFSKKTEVEILKQTVDSLSIENKEIKKNILDIEIKYINLYKNWEEQKIINADKSIK